MFYVYKGGVNFYIQEYVHLEHTKSLMLHGSTFNYHALTTII